MAKQKRPTKCISVRLKSFFPIKGKSVYIAYDYNGHKDVIPEMAYFGKDEDVKKGNAYWIAKWTLKKDETELNHKYKPKTAYFDENRKRCPPPVRCERRTTFTVTYKKKGEDTAYVRKTIADNEDTAKSNMKKKFLSGELEFNYADGELEIISIETRPGRKK